MSVSSLLLKMEGLREQLWSKIHTVTCHMKIRNVFGVLFKWMLTCNDVEQSGVENGRTDQS